MMSIVPSHSPSAYDLIVIGSGQAGNPLASAFHAKGKRVAVIERAAVGGTCVNYGCTPTKTMVASAQVADLARRSQEFGIHVGAVEVDMRAVVARKDHIVEESRQGNEQKFKKGIDLLRGTGSFVAPNLLSVALNDGGQLQLTADCIVIDTGLSPSLPEIQGIQSVTCLDNVSIMQLDSVPHHLLILGGGYIGLEFAQMFRRFGSDVTIIQSDSQLLEREDPDVAGAMADMLRQDGIQIFLDSKATSLAPSPSGVQLTLESGGQTQTLHGTHLLVATGRTPNTKDLNLDAANIRVDEHGFIQVNECLETSAAGVFAAGDVKGGPAFTHIAYDDFRILKSRLLDNGNRVTTGRPVPYCVYTDPQLGRIGMSETAARKAGCEYKLARIEMSAVSRAYETGQTRGFMKALVDPQTSEILGAAVLGADGGEIMSMLQIAMMGKLPYTALRDAILAHPTLAESLNSLFMSPDLD